LCDGFETDTVGGPPSAARWSIVTGCGQNDPTSTVTVVGNATHPAHSGQNSVQVVGGNNTCGPLFIHASAFQTPGLESSVYGRFWVELSTALPATHVALMALGLGADAGDPTMLQISQELQLTAQYNVFVWNYRDTTLPDMAPGFAPPINTWTCVEFHTDMTTGELDTWIGGNPVPEMTFVPGTTAVQTGTNDHWSGGRPQPLVVSSVGFGWVNFGGGPSTLWFDDIALGPARIGCD
jgi:hypothetical protein